MPQTNLAKNARAIDVALGIINDVLGPHVVARLELSHDLGAIDAHLVVDIGFACTDYWMRQHCLAGAPIFTRPSEAPTLPVERP